MPSLHSWQSCCVLLLRRRLCMPTREWHGSSVAALALLILFHLASSAYATPEKEPARIRSAYAAGRLGQAIASSRDLVNQLADRLDGEVRAAFPPAPAGWATTPTTAPESRERFIAGEFEFGRRYDRPDEGSITLRLVATTEGGGIEVGALVDHAPEEDRFVASGRRPRHGRWVLYQTDPPSHGLIVVLSPMDSCTYVELRGSPGLPRDALLELASYQNLRDLDLPGGSLRALSPRVRGRGPGVERLLESLDSMLPLAGRKSGFAVPLCEAREAVAQLSMLRARRLTSQIGPIPSGWKADEEPEFRASPCRAASAYSRRYRMGDASLVVSIHLGESSSEGGDATRRSTIEWDEWTEVTLGSRSARSRSSRDRDKIEIELGLGPPWAKVVVFGDGATGAATKLATALDLDALSRSIEDH